MFYNNPIYNFLLERKSSTEISFIPESLWVGDPDNGKKIVDGFMNFNGESIVFDKQTWKKNKGSRSWNEELSELLTVVLKATPYFLVVASGDKPPASPA